MIWKKLAIIFVLFLALLFVGRYFFSEKTWYEKTSDSIRRFEEVIVEPIPKNIYDISTGYHSYGIFNRTVIFLKFKYKGNFEENKFIKEWTLAEYGPNSWFDINSTKVYKKPDKNYKYTNWQLFIDEQLKTAILFSSGG